MPTLTSALCYLRCLILQQLMLQLIHLLLWVDGEHCHLLIGGQFFCWGFISFFFFWRSFFPLKDHFIVVSEVNCTLFCGEWKIQVGHSGMTSWFLQFQQEIAFARTQYVCIHASCSCLRAGDTVGSNGQLFINLHIWSHWFVSIWVFIHSSHHL